MAVYTTIEVPAYIAEYLIARYDDGTGAVKFRPGANISFLIFDMLSKRPADMPVDRGNLRILLPDKSEDDGHGKDPRVYNYISARGQAIIAKRLVTEMWADWHEFADENKHQRGIGYKESAIAFVESYGIQSISEDALLKNYQRWRDKLRRRQKRGYTKKGDK